MKILCSWCGAVIREEDGSEGLNSHGICQICAPQEMTKINLTKDGQCGDQAKPKVNPNIIK
jgi:hypothetical protein